jgi:lysophospholipase L1-like esterase
MPDDVAQIRRLLAGNAPLKYVFAGDSIAQGALHTMGWRDYTQLFAERVRFEMSRRQDVVINTAVSGWRIGDVAAGIDWGVLQFRPQVVSIAVGTNDCVDGEAGLVAFRATLDSVIDRVRDGAGAAVMLHTPPRLLPLDESRWSNLHLYVEQIRELAEAKKAALMDHYAEWSDAADGGVPLHWLGDAIHPNEYGHRAMARLMFRTLGIWDSASDVCRLYIP